MLVPIKDWLRKAQTIRTCRIMRSERFCEFAPGAAVAVQAGRRTIAVFRVGGEFFAVSNACPHKGASLCDGEIIIADKLIRCPWHHWNWRLYDGKLESDPRQSLRTRVEQELVTAPV